MRTFLDSHPKYYLLNFLYYWRIIMKEDKNWMLMTYYCPTHGNLGKAEPIHVIRQEISNRIINKKKSKKDI